jgi:histone deacetylase HOS2
MPYREAFRREGFTLFPNLGTWRKENQNSQEQIQKIITHVREQLRYIRSAPSVQMKYIPPDIQGWRNDVEDELKEKRIERDEAREERDGAGGLIAKISKRKEFERNGMLSAGGNVKLGEFTI